MERETDRNRDRGSAKEQRSVYYTAPVVYVRLRMPCSKTRSSRFKDAQFKTLVMSSHLSRLLVDRHTAETQQEGSMRQIDSGQWYCRSTRRLEKGVEELKTKKKQKVNKIGRASCRERVASPV